MKKRLLKTIWSQQNYYDEALESALSGFSKNEFLLKLKDYVEAAKVILDCGCGSASILEKICHPGGNFYGVDISPMGIKLAKERLKNKKNIKLLVGDLERLKFKDNFFDLVYAAYTLEHLTNPERAIKEMVRVTKKGGRLVLISPNYGSPLYPSPSSPPEGNSLTTRAIKQFAKSYFYLFKKPADLGWLKVQPLCLKAKKWQPDWDTVVEPCLQTLLYFLKRNQMGVVESFSGFQKEETDIELNLTRKSSLRQRILSVCKQIALILKKMDIVPYKYFGSTFFVVGKKK